VWGIEIGVVRFLAGAAYLHSSQVQETTKPVQEQQSKARDDEARRKKGDIKYTLFQHMGFSSHALSSYLSCTRTRIHTLLHSRTH